MGEGRTREKELVKNTAILTFGKVCSKLVGFFQLPLYTAILPAEEYGTADLVLTYVSLLYPVVAMSFEQALFRWLVDARGERAGQEELISTGLAFLLWQSAVACVFLWVVGHFVESRVYGYFCTLVLLSVWREAVLQISRGIGDTFAYSLGSSLMAIAMMLCNVLFLLFLRMGMEGLLLANCVGDLACILVLLWRCRILRYLRFGRVGFPGRARLRLLREMLRYALPMLPNRLSWWVLGVSDRIVVSLYIGVWGNGILAVAGKFPNVFQQVMAIFTLSWTESVALHIKDQDAPAFFQGTLSTVYGVLLSLCCGMVAVMPFAFRYLVHSQYEAAYVLIPPLLAASVLESLCGLYGAVFVALRKTQEIAMTSFLAAVVNLLTHLALLGWIGLLAAPVSTLLGYGTMAVWRYLRGRRYVGIRFQGFASFPWKPFLLGGGMAGVSLLSYYWGSTPVQVAALLLVIALSIVMNRVLLWRGWAVLKGHLRRLP